MNLGDNMKLIDKKQIHMKVYSYPFKYKDFNLTIEMIESNKVKIYNFRLYDTKYNFEPYIVQIKSNCTCKTLLKELKNTIKYELYKNTTDKYRYSIAIPYYFNLCFILYKKINGKSLKFY